jgi:hypothetical protein
MNQMNFNKNELIKNIIKNLSSQEWIKNKINEIEKFPENYNYNKTIPLEYKVIIQQCKIIIIESFWNYVFNKIKLNSNLLFNYNKKDELIVVELDNFQTYSKAKEISICYELTIEEDPNEKEIDSILRIANVFWLDYINKEIILFEKIFFQPNKADNYYHLKLLYTKIESYYFLEKEKESWIGNLEQEFAPLFKIFFRGIKYEKQMMKIQNIDVFVKSLYNCIRKEAIENSNNFIFSDTDFENFSNSCPVFINKNNLEKIKSNQKNERFNDTVLGCPAIFSKLSSEYRYNQLFKDLFYWQMDLYKEIIILHNEKFNYTSK